MTVTTWSEANQQRTTDNLEFFSTGYNTKYVLCASLFMHSSVFGDIMSIMPIWYTSE